MPVLTKGEDVMASKIPAGQRSGVQEATEKRRKKLLESLRKAEEAVQIPGFCEQEILYAEAQGLAPTERRKQMATIEKAVGGKRHLRREERRRAHDARGFVLALYEDFIYYQTEERRREYNQHIDDIKHIKKKPFSRGQPPALLSMNDAYDAKLRPILESFESNEVGRIENLEWQNMGPSELHIRLPRSKRFTIGLGKMASPPERQPLNLILNHDAIEKRRREVEDENKDSKMSESHSERRAREVKNLGKPPTNFYVHPSIPTAKDLGGTRLKSGLFIAAGETSNDWNTSYDQLDVVAPGHIPDLPGKPMPELTTDELNEFCKSPTTPVQYDAVINHNHLEVTSWSEATYGRKERDVHEDLPPCSPVDSPPHSPIVLPKTADPALHIPVDVDHLHDNFARYRRRFKDQYGVNYTNWPAFGGKPKREGYRIAYEPLDVAALPEKHQEKYHLSEGLLDETGRFAFPAPDGTSMRLLREALNEPYRPPTLEKVPDGDDESSSDDGNDLFKISYRQCSRSKSCPCGNEDSDNGDDDNSNDGGAGGEGSQVEPVSIAKTDKEGNGGPVKPVSVAGGPLIPSESQSDTAGNEPKKHDYKQYNRVQLRQACKYLGLPQNAPKITELYERAEKWNREHPADAFHNYIIKQKDVARSFNQSKSKKITWKDAYGSKIDEQNEQNEESEDEREEEQEDNP